MFTEMEESDYGDQTHLCLPLLFPFPPKPSFPFVQAYVASNLLPNNNPRCCMHCLSTFPGGQFYTLPIAFHSLRSLSGCVASFILRNTNKKQNEYKSAAVTATLKQAVLGFSKESLGL